MLAIVRGWIPSSRRKIFASKKERAAAGMIPTLGCEPTRPRGNDDSLLVLVGYELLGSLFRRLNIAVEGVTMFFA